MNKKITLYELLGMVKDGKAPKEIKYNNYLLSFDDIDKDYYCEFYGNLFEYLFTNIKTTDLLNDEVEILDDEDMEDKTKPLTKKDIEALGYACGEIKKCFEMGWNKSLNNEQLDEDMEIEELRFTGDGYVDYTNVIPKINQLVREINKLKKDK